MFSFCSVAQRVRVKTDQLGKSALCDLTKVMSLISQVWRLKVRVRKNMVLVGDWKDLEICDVSFKVQGERTDMIIPPHDLNALKALKAVYNEEKA